MRRLVALAGLGVVFLVGSVASASPTDPIVGTWAYGEGRVVVRGSGTLFTATVTAATRFAVCTHARGEQMWTIAHPGRWYSGRHLSFDDRIPGCDADDRVWLPAAWSVEGNRLTVRIARFAGLAPGPCGSALTVCFTLRRVVRPSAATDEAPTRHAFTVAVSGRPALGAKTLGRGYLGSIVEGEGGFTERGSVILSSSGVLTVTHDYEEAADVKVRLRVRGKGALGPEGTASLTVAVASSSSPFCFVGEEGTLVLSRGRAILSVCGDNLQFVHGRPAGTAVTVAIRLRS